MTVSVFEESLIDTFNLKQALFAEASLELVKAEQQNISGPIYSDKNGPFMVVSDQNLKVILCVTAMPINANSGGSTQYTSVIALKNPPGREFQLPAAYSFRVW